MSGRWVARRSADLKTVAADEADRRTPGQPTRRLDGPPECGPDDMAGSVPTVQVVTDRATDLRDGLGARGHPDRADDALLPGAKTLRHFQGALLVLCDRRARGVVGTDMTGPSTEGKATLSDLALRFEKACAAAFQHRGAVARMRAAHSLGRFTDAEQLAPPRGATTLNDSPRVRQ